MKKSVILFSLPGMQLVNILKLLIHAEDEMAIQVGTEKVIEAAKTWKNVCLISGKSIFSQRALWTKTNLSELSELFIEHPDESKDKVFLKKLEGQLSSGSDEAKNLASEILWLLFLVPVKQSMGLKRKIQQIKIVWSWSSIPSNSESEFSFSRSFERPN